MASGPRRTLIPSARSSWNVRRRRIFVVRPTAEPGPWPGGCAGWLGRPGSTSDGGSRGAWRACGRLVGRCASLGPSSGTHAGGGTRCPHSAGGRAANGRTCRSETCGSCQPSTAVDDATTLDGSRHPEQPGSPERAERGDAPSRARLARGPWAGATVPVLPGLLPRLRSTLEASAATAGPQEEARQAAGSRNRPDLVFPQVWTSLWTC